VDRPPILVIDDQAAVRFALTQYFRAFGYEVHCAGTREEAHALLTRTGYGAVITDLHLTGAHTAEGLDLISLARERGPATPLILLTAYSSPALEAEARRRGATVVCSKPTPLLRLAQTVAGLMEGRREPDPDGERLDGVSTQ
jgi:CheY-like chemotaxis protein